MVQRWSLVALCVLVTVLLPLSFPAGGGPTASDRAVMEGIHRAFDGHRWIYRVLLVPSDAAVVIGVLVLGVVALAWRRRWWAAVFLAVVPESAVAVNEFLLKPLWDRHLHDYLAYPSGHTFQFVAVGTGLVLVAGTSRIALIETVLTLVLLPVIAIGMIGLGYHYPTDILGGACAAVASVLILYSVARSVRRPPSRSPERVHVHVE